MNLKRENNSKGVTLIALVITIIVLLILVAVSITALTGQEGILTKAKQAAQNTLDAEADEKAKLGESENYLNKYTGGSSGGSGGGSEVTPTPPTEAVTENTYYKDTTSGDKIAVIPQGFKVSTVAKEQKIDSGLVVIGPDDSEFVWVPVDKTTFDTNFKRVEGYYNGSLDSMISNYGEADASGANAKVTESATTQQEAKDMYKSVKDNGGFYIARYETGKETGDIAVSKKNAAVWNNISWSSSVTMTVDTGGAVEKARNFATQHSYTGVQSMLCYGVQWDAAMNFIDSNYLTRNCATNSYVRDSTDKGWYSNNYSSGNSSQATGIDVGTGTNCVNNIYDLGGNVWEWTMESYLTGYRVYRGGRCYDTGSRNPASGRGSRSPDGSGRYLGFRLTLIV